MKKTAWILILALIVGLLSGCAGTAVVYTGDCTCPTEGASVAVTQPAAEGSLKTGLAVVGNVSDSTDGKVKYDVTVAAVLVDENGMIVDCKLDSLGAEVNFDETGVITSDLTAALSTKNELGDSYGMKAYGGAKYEWYEQAAALSGYAMGKTVEELRNGAVNESGKAADADLASTATIYLGGYVSAIEEAVNNAQFLGASAGDRLSIAVVASLGSSTSATDEGDGVAQLDCDVTALSMNGDTITSCTIDSLQAKVSFSNAGTITADLGAPVQTKNQLGEAYGMKAWAGAKYEWNEQAASFAAYVTGKTADEVEGIAVDESAKPTDADLSASVTISVGGFKALVCKAARAQ